MNGKARLARRVAWAGLGTAIVPLDTAVNVAFPAISTSFGFEVERIQWVAICYVLTHASLMLAFGRVGDLVGHRRVFRAGLLWNFVALLLCALAPSYEWLLAFRVLQGVGAGLVISCAPALITGMFPAERRNAALGTFTLIFALGSACGPLIGGVLVQLWGWPAVFWFRAPLALASALWLPMDDTPLLRKGDREPLDLVGAILLAFGLATALLALDELRRSGLSGPAFPALAVIAALCGWGFLRQERRAPHPIVALAPFAIPAFTIANIASAILNMAIFAVLLFVPYYLTRLTAFPTAFAGIILATPFIGMSAASPAGGWLLGRMPAPLLAILGAAATGAGLILIGCWGASPPLWLIFLSLAIEGSGFGLFQVAYMARIMATLPQRHHGVAGSLAMLTRTIGIVSGASLLTLLFHAAGGGAASDAAFLGAFRLSFLAAGFGALAASACMALTGIAERRGRRR